MNTATWMLCAFFAGVMHETLQTGGFKPALFLLHVVLILTGLYFMQREGKHVP